MPDVATVAAVVDREYDHGPNDQNAVAINMASALILLRQLMQYRAGDATTLSPEQRERMHALEDSYLLAELAIGRKPGGRRGALTAAQVQQYYSSRRYEACDTAACYQYWVRAQLELWNAAAFRQRLIPLLFQCAGAPEMLDLASRNAMSAPLIPFTPAAPLGGDAAAIARLEMLAPKPAPCGADGFDVDGDGLCFDWERVRATNASLAIPNKACRAIELVKVRMKSPQSLRVLIRAGTAQINTSVRFRVSRAAKFATVGASEVPSQPATVLSENAANPASPLYAVVSLDVPLTPDPVPSDPAKTLLPFVIVDTQSIPSSGPVHCEQPLQTWLPAQLDPEPIGLHGPYPTFGGVVTQHEPFGKAIVMTDAWGFVKAEHGFLILRKGIAGKYYTTPPVRSTQSLTYLMLGGGQPILQPQDYYTSFQNAFRESCEDPGDFVVDATVHTHPRQDGAPDNFSALDFRGDVLEMLLTGNHAERMQFGADNWLRMALREAVMLNVSTLCRRVFILPRRFVPLPASANDEQITAAYSRYVKASCPK